MFDTLAYLVKSDLDGPEFESNQGKDIWEEITQKALDFPSLLERGLVGALRSGDGAFKISVDPDISPYPLVEWYEADKVEYETRRGKITGVIFWTDFTEKGKTYRLRECYRKGSVTYQLFDGERETSMGRVPALAGLRPIEFSGDYMMAVPLMFYQSVKFPGRGKSIYDGKTDNFDALDEVVSQWMDAIRDGRVKKYIPRNMVPTEPETGKLLLPNDFGSHYIAVNDMISETGTPKMEVVQPDIRYDAYQNTYMAVLDMCLQGILSPATLGIDVGKMSSADAQREKKDVTGYTRNTITDKLEQVLPELIRVILWTYDTMQQRPLGQYNPTTSFGEYGAPDFDSRVETVNKAAAAATMSIETQVDEMWGDSKDEAWKKQEVSRIKQMRGIEETDEPQIGGDLVDLA